MGGQAAVTATIRAKRGESTFAAPAANFWGFSWSKRLRRSQIEAIFLPSLLLFLVFSPGDDAMVSREHLDILTTERSDYTQ